MPPRGWKNRITHSQKAVSYTHLDVYKRQDIEGLRLGHRTDHRMKRFILRQGADAESAIGQPDKFVIRDQRLLVTRRPKHLSKRFHWTDRQEMVTMPAWIRY